MAILSVPTANAWQSKALDVLERNLISMPQQARVAHQIEQTTRELEVLLLGRGEAYLVARLRAESWCVVECLDHLTQTTRAFLPAIAAAVAEAPKLRKNRLLRTGILPSLFIWHLNPPYRIRFKVLPQLAPQQANAETAWSTFVESQRELLAILSSAAGLGIDKVRIKSPVYAHISYNIYATFRMLAAHQRRHLWQVEQILKALDKEPASLLLKHST